MVGGSFGTCLQAKLARYVQHLSWVSPRGLDGFLPMGLGFGGGGGGVLDGLSVLAGGEE